MDSREEIRSKVFTRSEPEIRQVEFRGTHFQLVKASFRQRQDARRLAVSSEKTVDLDYYLFALLVMTAQDAAGDAIFAPADRDFILLHADPDEVEALMDIVMDLNGLSKKAEEERVKASARTGAGDQSSPSAGSSAGSPVSSTGALSIDSKSQDPAGSPAFSAG